MPDIIAALEEMYREKAAGRVEMPPKPGIHTMQTVACNLGLALADMAVAPLIYRRALECGVGA